MDVIDHVFGEGVEVKMKGERGKKTLKEAIDQTKQKIKENPTLQDISKQAAELNSYLKSISVGEVREIVEAEGGKTTQGRLLAKDAGSVSLESDIDLTFYFETADDKRLKRLKDYLSRHRDFSLAKKYDMNIYVDVNEHAEITYKYQEKDIPLLKEALLKKLYVAGVLEEVKLQDATTKDITEDIKEMKLFMDRSRTNDMVAIIYHEKDIYNTYFNRFETFLNDVSVKNRLDFDSFKIEGSFLLATLEVYFHVENTNISYSGQEKPLKEWLSDERFTSDGAESLFFKSDGMIKFLTDLNITFGTDSLYYAFLENMCDIFIHTTEDSDFYRYTKYFQRLLLSLMCLRTKGDCTKEGTWKLIYYCLKFHELSRKGSGNEITMVRERGPFLAYCCMKCIKGEKWDTTFDFLNTESPDPPIVLEKLRYEFYNYVIERINDKELKTKIGSTCNLTISER